MKQVLKGGLVGVVIAYAYYLLSWGVLPLSQYGIQQIDNESFVGWILKRNAPESGVYLIPYPSSESASKEVEYGSPFVFLSIKSEGISWMPYFRCMGVQLAIAFLLAALLLTLRPSLSYMAKVGILTGVALIANIMVNLPNWNWWGFSWAYTWRVSLDLLIATFLSALGIVAVMRIRSSLQQQDN